MVTRSGRMLRMTSVNDVYVPRVIAAQLRFKGTGLFLGDKLAITDINGTPIADHFVVNVNEDQPLIDNGRRIFCNGVKILSMPGGTCEVEFFLD